ncbi:MAG: beta-glucuronidase [Agarilytica sp.]
MLYPVDNQFRQKKCLSGLWDFKIDKDKCGENEAWYRQLQQPEKIAVPSSWNELYPQLKDYLGCAWYQKHFYAQKCSSAKKYIIRFDSVNYFAKVWLNGTCLGEHEGGHLPFEFDVSNAIVDGANHLVVLVENELKPQRVPPGNCGGWQAGASTTYPDANFDFFPYAGIQRDVYLLTIPEREIADVTVVTAIENKNGLVDITVYCPNRRDKACKVLCEIAGYVEEADIVGEKAQIHVHIPRAKFWSCEQPHLYTLNAYLIENEKTIDHYSLNIGIRTVEIKEDQLLLNGEKIFLKGFGRHEDFYVSGRGANLPLLIKDHALLKWVGANSYRTSHYPYCEEALQLADEQGILIISETPAVGLRFDDGKEYIEARQAQVLEQISTLVKRDKNHPSVIMWCVANEPCPSQHPDSFSQLEAQLSKQVEDNKENDAAYTYVKQMLDQARRFDSSRPIAFVALLGSPNAWFELSDVLMINRYWGWYVKPADLSEAEACLAEELDALHAQFNKPVMLAEFGADTVAGQHSISSEMFSEEFQRDFIECYLNVVKARDYVVGAHVWNFADFKTGQGVMRVGAMNLKGVFTRARAPKLAAHYLKSIWGEE